MRVRELIAELQRCDPEAVVSNVSRVDQMPGFYDGCSHYLVHNEDEVVGYVIDRHHAKVVFYEVDLTCALMENPALPVTFIAYDGTRYDLTTDGLPKEAERYAAQVTKSRKVAANIHASAKSAIPIKDQLHCAECFALMGTKTTESPSPLGSESAGKE